MTHCDVSFLSANPYVRHSEGNVEEIPSLEAFHEYHAIRSVLNDIAIQENITLTIKRSIANAKTLFENVSKEYYYIYS